MEKLKGCPIYVWVFSFFATFVLVAVSMLQFVVSFFQRKFQFDLWMKLFGEFVLDWIVLFMLPCFVFSLIFEHFAPGLWNWLGFLTAYILGIFSAVRMYHWRKAHL